MSKPLTSYDPKNKKILDLIYGLSNKALDKELADWSKDKKQNDFFAAACCKQGAGAVRILASHGLYCEQRVLDLAVQRKCWNVCKALAKVVPSLSPLYIESYGGTLTDHPLLDALAAGEDELARLLFEIPMSGVDQKNKASFALHALAKNSKKEPGAAKSVGWLVQAGANPNQELIRRFHPLTVSLERGDVLFAMALLDAGADLTALPDPGAKVATALYRSRVSDPKHIQAPRISEDGWRLVDRALEIGVQLPSLKLQDPVRGGPGHEVIFEGFDRITGRLHVDDVLRLNTIFTGERLREETAPAPTARPSPRL